MLDTGPARKGLEEEAMAQRGYIKEWPEVTQQMSSGGARTWRSKSAVICQQE